MRRLFLMCLLAILSLVLGCGASRARHEGAAYTAAPEATADYAVAVAGGPGEVEHNTEAYDHIKENSFVRVEEQPLSTFGVDVDTASYSNVRRFLTEGRRPPPGAVRIEELVNYFSYSYPQPTGEHPFSVQTEVSESPWNKDNLLLHIGLQGKSIATGELPPRNLVFLLDVSGSMNDPRKLPLLKSALHMLVENLTERDRVAIVVYAGAAGAVLDPTAGSDGARILSALDRLEAGGSTNGGDGIELAYRLAEENFRANAINRVILATDGDFNVGTSDESSLVELIEEKRESGIFLTVLGFGTGNLKDSTMEKLADHGNGNYAYIDSIAEARKVLVTEAGSTLVTIAKDVKLQVEFNPAEVAEYRLIGYENRVLANRDFDDDTKDAGEIGAGHSVTALYELVPAKAGDGNDSGLTYQGDRPRKDAANSGEFATIAMRYKQPDGDTSKLLRVAVGASKRVLAESSNDFRFAAAVAGFGMLLRGSEHSGALTWSKVSELAGSARGTDPHGHRAEFLELVTRAAALVPAPTQLAK